VVQVPVAVKDAGFDILGLGLLRYVLAHTGGAGYA
jgi:hypothetical protein